MASHRIPVTRASPRRIVRARLLGRLQTARMGWCVVLHGPAGCGKTELLEGWRPLLAQAGFKLAWLSLPASTPPFPYLLLEAIGLCLPEVAADAQRIASTREAPLASEDLIRALLAGVGDRALPMALVIDAGSEQPSAELLQLMQSIIDEAPPNALTVIASRRRLPLALSRRRARGELLELGFDALRFSADESHQFLQSAGGSALGEDDRQALAVATEGWPMALRLLSNETSSRRKAIGVATCPELQHYLTSEVLGSLTPRELAFLRAASLPARICAPLMTNLLSPDTPLNEAMACMESLEAADLLRPVEGASAEWRQVQPVVRAVLMQELPGADSESLHRSAWHWFERNGHAIGAVHHAAGAGSFDDAARLAQKWLPAFFEQGRIWDLVRIFRELPADFREQPELRLWRAWDQLLEHDYEGCRATLPLLAEESLPSRERFRVTLLRALLAMLCDDTRSAIDLLPHLEAAPADADAFALAGRRNVLTWAYLRRGEHERARQVQFEATVLVDGRPFPTTPFGTLAGNSLVGLSHAVEGRVVLAERIYREVLYQAELRGADGVDQAYTAAALLGEILYELNDVEGAAQLLETRRDLLDRVSMPDTILRVLLTLARTRWLAGRRDDAFDALHRLTHYADERQLPRLLGHGLLEQLALHLRCGEEAAALVLRDRLRSLEPPAGEAIGPWNVDLMLATGRARMLFAQHEGRLREALQECEGLIELCRTHHRQRRAAVLAIPAAAIERSAGQGSRSVERLRSALRWGRSLGLVRSLLDADPRAATLLQEAVESGALDAVDAIDARRVCAAARTDETVAKQPAAINESPLPASETLNERERDVARLLAQFLSNKEIAKALGLSPETVKWHLKNIYMKLHVSSRADVVARLGSGGAPAGRGQRTP